MMADVGLREAILRIALLNAVDHGGKAKVEPVLGRLLAERPDLKANVKVILDLIKAVVNEVNALSLNEQRNALEAKWPDALVKRRVEEEKALPPLPNVEKYECVITRFSPNPDCVLHIGSARAVILCYEYAKMYNGRFYLRFEDTDPKLKKPSLEFYDAIKHDIEWLNCKWDGEFIQSDRLLIYYECAEKLLEDGNAYVCTCERDDFRRAIAIGRPCPCRELEPEVHLERWQRMIDGTYEEGDAVVRIKTDLSHPNPAVRDWPALRIINVEKYPHPRVGDKYRIWPLYNFACGIDDHLMGVTHIIRGKEHLTNQVKQEYLFHHLNWSYPEAIHYGRLKVVGAVLSKSKIVQGVKSGLFKGWDDPRLATLMALRRRGVTSEAIRRLMIEIGPKAVDIVLSWENLYAYNRKVIDKTVDRYFFVKKPIRLIVRGLLRSYVANVRLHPDHPERGFRSFAIRPREGAASLWISADDLSSFKEGAIVRLMELFNVYVEGVREGRIEAAYHSDPYEEAKKLGAPLVHWIPAGAEMPCEVVMPDATIAEGLAELECKGLALGTMVQFERFGFVKIDRVNDKLVAYYAHR